MSSQPAILTDPVCQILVGIVADTWQEKDTDAERRASIIGMVNAFGADNVMAYKIPGTANNGATATTVDGTTTYAKTSFFKLQDLIAAKIPLKKMLDSSLYNDKASGYKAFLKDAYAISSTAPLGGAYNFSASIVTPGSTALTLSGTITGLASNDTINIGGADKVCTAVSSAAVTLSVAAVYNAAAVTAFKFDLTPNGDGVVTANVEAVVFASGRTVAAGSTFKIGTGTTVYTVKASPAPSATGFSFDNTSTYLTSTSTVLHFTTDVTGKTGSTATSTTLTVSSPTGTLAVGHKFLYNSATYTISTVTSQSSIVVDTAVLIASATSVTFNSNFSMSSDDATPIPYNQIGIYKIDGSEKSSIPLTSNLADIWYGRNSNSGVSASMDALVALTGALTYAQIKSLINVQDPLSSTTTLFDDSATIALVQTATGDRYATAQVIITKVSIKAVAIATLKASGNSKPMNTADLKSIGFTAADLLAAKDSAGANVFTVQQVIDATYLMSDIRSALSGFTSSLAEFKKLVEDSGSSTAAKIIARVCSTDANIYSRLSDFYDSSSANATIIQNGLAIGDYNSGIVQKFFMYKKGSSLSTDVISDFDKKMIYIVSFLTGPNNMNTAMNSNGSMGSTKGEDDLNAIYNIVSPFYGKWTHIASVIEVATPDAAWKPAAIGTGGAQSSSSKTVGGLTCQQCADNFTYVDTAGATQRWFAITGYYVATLWSLGNMMAAFPLKELLTSNSSGPMIAVPSTSGLNIVSNMINSSVSSTASGASSSEYSFVTYTKLINAGMLKADILSACTTSSSVTGRRSTVDSANAGANNTAPYFNTVAENFVLYSKDMSYVDADTFCNASRLSQFTAVSSASANNSDVINATRFLKSEIRSLFKTISEAWLNLKRSEFILLEFPMSGAGAITRTFCDDRGLVLNDFLTATQKVNKVSSSYIMDTGVVNQLVYHSDSTRSDVCYMFDSATYGTGASSDTSTQISATLIKVRTVVNA